MKKITLCLILSFQCAFFNLFAQAPQAIPYQAAARDNSGAPIPNQLVSLRFSIRNASAAGTVVYRETHSVTTNTLGLFKVNIGEGTVLIGTLNSIDWEGGNKFIQVELDVTGGNVYVDMGTQQVLSVPYALNAANGNWTKSGNDISNSNTGNVGIGIPAPAAKLDINGNIKITDGTQGTGKVLKSNATGLASWGNISGNDLIAPLPNPDFSCLALTGSVSAASDASSVAVLGNYAYVVSGNSDLFQVFNATNLASPVLTGSVSIVSGSSPHSVVAAGSYAYVVNYISDELQVYNISNPASPGLVGSIGTGQTPYSIALSGSYLYITCVNSHSLQIYNISNPALPVLTSSTNTGGGAYSVAISGNYAYVVNVSTNNLQVYNITNPVLPALTGTISTGTQPFDVAVSGNYVYVVHNLANIMQIYNVSNPASPALINTIGTLSNPLSVIVSGNFAFVTCALANSLQMFNISTPASPVLANTIGTGGSPHDVTISGSYAYVANASGSMQIFNFACNQSVNINPVTGTLTSQTSTWNLSANNIYNTNSGNVGIGTNSPANKLDVEGGVAIGSTFSGTNAAPASGAIIEGKLGIGTNNPTYKLTTAFSPGSSNSVPTSGVTDGQAGFRLTGGVVALDMGILVGGASYIQNRNIGNYATSYDLGINPAGGNVGIGNTSPGQKLSVSGNICYTGSIGACSDIRYKKKIVPLSGALDNVLKMQGVFYYWKTNEFPDKKFNDNKQIGFIAQDIEKLYPELVITDPDGYKSVDYSKLTPILVEAIKELKAENEKLKNDNAAFKKDISEIKAQLGMNVKAQLK